MNKIIALVIGLVGVLLVGSYLLKDQSSSKEYPSPPPVPIQASSVPNIKYGFNLDSLHLRESIIQANESLGSILSEYNVSNAVIASIAQLPKDLFDVRKLRVNKPYSLIESPDSGKALGFVYHPTPMDYVVLRLSDSISVEKGRHQTDTVIHSMGGIIQTSLYESILAQGGSAALVNELFDIFAWDIDFWAIHKGDSYKVRYTTYELEGEPVGFGRIQAAVIDHLGEPHFAFSFDQEEGMGVEYFDSDGESRKGDFLRVPLQYSRISSRFTHSRFHPILKRRRPHYGVDFAAPRGTPVYAIGEGSITKAHYNRGAGNMVKIQHGEGFESGYLHLSGFAKGIKKGVRVAQGQTIGYVGSTGLSTGPHLDFRIWKNGTPLNPLRLSKPSSEGVCDELKQEFSLVQNAYRKQLNEIELIVSEEVAADTTVVPVF